jgi:AcrR family transcriptional regulator
MVMGAHLKRDERRRQLLDAGVPLAEVYGYRKVTREMVADKVGCSPSLLSKYWTAPEWRNALIIEAIARFNLTIIAQGITDRNPLALAAPSELKMAALRFVLGEH